MPRVTEYFGIQSVVPFVDVELETDNKLYLDPFAIRIHRDSLSAQHRALECLDTFAQEVKRCLLAGASEGAPRGEVLLQKFSEPWETRLGVSSRGFRGRGGAMGLGSCIWQVLMGEAFPLVARGILGDVEDYPLFIKGVDRDRTSDITTRIVFDSLVGFTQSVLVSFPEFYSGPHRLEPFVKKAWSPEHRGWVDAEVLLPVAEGQALLLVPKEWVRSSLYLSARRFYETAVLSFVQGEGLVADAAGRVSKKSKDQLKRLDESRPIRSANLQTTVRAFAGGSDLVAEFKAHVYARGRLCK